ncbi:Peroxidase 22 [Zea mays]|uniref:Peroxidase 22 n=1 Tax=Zea mays TaxID=4577 RepID=A0A1D6NYM3_MAIZE|nr:Peroxidase 22 [Zea mays]
MSRLDSRKASLDLANSDIPTAQQVLLTLLAKFWEKGLDATDMVALVDIYASSHTIGFARCDNFRDRIYGVFEMTTSKYSPSSKAYLDRLKEVCPREGDDDDNVSAMDSHTSAVFDNTYFKTIVKGEGLRPWLRPGHVCQHSS